MRSIIYRLIVISFAYKSSSFFSFLLLSATPLFSSSSSFVSISLLLYFCSPTHCSVRNLRLHGIVSGLFLFNCIFLVPWCKCNGVVSWECFMIRVCLYLFWMCFFDLISVPLRWSLEYNYHTLLLDCLLVVNFDSMHRVICVTT